MLPPNRPSAARNNDSPRVGCYTAVSMHPGGANALYGDGHVDFVSEAIDREVWRELGSRSSLFLDGEER
jgi:prepilin-type processing-associated H-X9-DG protein